MPAAEAVVHIVPQLPPPAEGVGSYALALAAALAAPEAGFTSSFLVGDPTWRGSIEDGGVATALPARDAAALRSWLESRSARTVLLHYANYGYAANGCPGWLVEGLESWRHGAGERRLVTFFHEVYASSPLWRRAFWSSGHQRRLAARLAGASDAVATSLEVYRDFLAPWTSGREVAVIPVLSTVGEPAALPPLDARRPRLVVFGGAGTRARAYGPYLNLLTHTCQALEIEEILDIGPGLDLPTEVGGIPVHRAGVLPPAAIRDLLVNSQAGFMAYRPDLLAKSTVFAAYAACGVLPVCARRGEPRACTSPPPDSYLLLPAGGPHTAPRAEPPVAGRRAAIPDSAGLAGIAAAANAWYRGHDLSRQATAFDRLLRRPDRPETPA